MRMKNINTVKIAGRRMSASGKRPGHGHGHGHHVESKSESAAAATDDPDAVPTSNKDDYPRPAAPGSSPPSGGGGFEDFGRRPEHVLHENAQGGGKLGGKHEGGATGGTHGPHGRIAQPASKALNV
ncbi:hypothetical protein BKA62DRAFT_779951 [Auriculariales sp. MPI-PUGE-AT-0066]|nr:hypothetical protein BKA62DRAFT_779951 [Auriculariales sp. MPI-PUGE-AT-0066]